MEKFWSAHITEDSQSLKFAGRMQQIIFFPVPSRMRQASIRSTVIWDIR